MCTTKPPKMRRLTGAMMKFGSRTSSAVSIRYLSRSTPLNRAATLAKVAAVLGAARLGGCHGANQLVNRMADQPIVAGQDLCINSRRVCAHCLAADPPYQVGPTILAVVQRLLHSAPSGLAQLAPDSDRRVVTPVDPDIGPAGHPALLSGQRLVHLAPAARRSSILEVHRNLRHSGHSQRPARTDHVLHRTGTDHSLAAVAQSADGRGLANWCGLPPRPIRPRTG